MEKKMIRKTTEDSFGYGSLDDLIEQLKLVETSLTQEGAQDIEVSLGESGEAYCDYSVVKFSYVILESDLEYQNRIGWEDKEQIRKLEQFERLKKELGK